MRRISVFAIIALLLTGAPLLAQASDVNSNSEASHTIQIDQEPVDPMEPRNAAELDLDDFLWVARPLIVFADSPADPRVIEQMQLLAEQPGLLIERDVVIIVDTDPSARSPFRLEMRPRGFSLVIITKSGSIGRRWPSPRDVGEISIAIDNFSLRQDALLTEE